MFENRTVSITRGDDTIKAIGLDDPLAFDPALGRRKRQLQEAGPGHI